MEQGACTNADPRLFYAEATAGTAYVQAKAICAACDVRNNCLAYALDNMRVSREEFTTELGIGLHGVWGGTTPQERERMIGRKAA